MINDIFSNPTNHINQQVKSKVIVLLWITMFWLLVALHQHLDRYTYGCMDVSFDHFSLIREMIVSIVFAGLVGGSALVFLWEKWLRKMSFIKALGNILLWNIGVYILVNIVSTINVRYFTSSQSTGNDLLGSILEAVFQPNALLNFVFWIFIASFTLFVLLIREKFGPKTFLSFLMGKYFRPRREHRIFMFMDLKSSTSIAERLGEVRYFNFLNDSFKTAIPGIIDTHGEIYQYVGDEIVVSWDLESGLKRANCIRCFYEMNERLKKREDYFKSTYGTSPEFKAGLHSGFVTAGEMGVVKRELAYSGDVLNTAARIQSMCNEFNVNMLISNALIDQIDKKELKVEVKSLGKIILKGKANQVEVATL